MPNLKFEDPENVLCGISYTGDLTLFLWQWKSTKVILALEKSKRNEKNINLSYTFFWLQDAEKQINKLDQTKGAPGSDIPTKIMP